MTTKFPDSTADTSTSTGTGAVVVSGTPPAQRRTFNSGVGDGNACRIRISDANGTAWEICDSVYTHSGTSLSRGTLHSSSTGSRITLSAGTHSVSVVEASADIAGRYAANRRFISGAEIDDASSTTLSCTAGACFVEGLDQIIEFAAPTTVTPTLAASTGYFVYLYFASLTTAPVTVVSTQAPATPFAGHARSAGADIGGNAANLHRLVGWFVSNSSSQIMALLMRDLGGGLARIRYTTNPFGGGPLQVLTNSTQATYASLNLSGVVPPAIAIELLATVFHGTSGSVGGAYLFVSLDGTNDAVMSSGLTNSTAGPQGVPQSLPLIPATPSIYYKVAGATGCLLSMYVLGYEFRR